MPAKEKVIIVTGSRIWPARAVVFGALRFHLPDLVVHGACDGPDLMSEEWAKINHVDYHGMPAKWRLNTRSDKSAGFKRNQRMLETYPGELLLAFPLGEAKGTRDCIARAEKLGHPIWIYGLDGEVIRRVEPSAPPGKPR